jgi:hypothetical protein
MRWALRRMILDEYNPNQPRDPLGQWTEGSGGGKVPAPALSLGGKETDALIDSKTKGTSAERVKMRNALKTETDPSKRKLLQQKVLDSFEMQYKKTGDVSIGMKLAKYEKQYGMKASGGTTGGPPKPLVDPDKSYGGAGYTGGKGPASTAASPEKGMNYGGGVKGNGEKLEPTAFTPEETATFKELSGMAEPNQAKTWMASAKAEIAAGNSKGLSHSDISHIKAYTGSGYRKTNSQLRKGTIDVDTFKHTRNLEKALDKLPPYKGEVGRKTDLSPEQFAKYQPGMVVKERGFTSSAKDKKKWSGDYHFVIQSKTGRDVSSLSSHKGETEVLFKPDTAFRVTKISGKSIHMEEFSFDE